MPAVILVDVTHLPQPDEPAVWAYAPLPASRPGPLPLVPVDYHQMLRGPRRRWWRPLVSLLLVLAMAGFAIVAITGVGAAIGGLDLPGLGTFDDDLSPINMISLDLALAALIPVSGLAVWAVHRVRPRFVSSVVGGIRWRWLARCVLVTLPVWALYMLLGTITDPPASGRPDEWVLLLVLAVVLTPFQAAGEEYLFRGWLVQNVGAFFGSPVVGLVASTLASAALFSLAHGSFDLWVILNISVLAVAACLTNWRTGGLEAGIALHLVNNVSVGVLTITVGGYADSFVSGDTTGTPLEVGVALLVHGIAVTLILWQARRLGLQRRFRPLVPPLEPRPAYVLADDRPIWTAPLE